ncbi:MAG: S8 family serine peptidase, partial [Candidatus Zixiibacteriota bacterium]
DGTEEIFYPAGYENVMAVAATDEYDNKAWFSNYGNWVDVASPGVYILSTIPGNQYAYFKGTSMASPFVAGLAGLLFSKYATSTNTWVFDEIRKRSDNINIEINGGRINAYYTLKRENRPPEPFPLIQPENNGYTLNQYPTFKWGNHLGCIRNRRAPCHQPWIGRPDRGVASRV